MSETGTEKQPKLFFVGVKGVIVADGKILLLKRSGEREFWDLPGGRIEQGERPETTLARELQEELPGLHGLSIKEQLWAQVIDREVKPGVGLVLSFYRVAGTDGGEVAFSDEHSESRWMNFTEAAQLHEQGLADIDIAKVIQTIVHL